MRKGLLSALALLALMGAAAAGCSSGYNSQTACKDSSSGDCYQQGATPGGY